MIDGTGCTSVVRLISNPDTSIVRLPPGSVRCSGFSTSISIGLAIALAIAMAGGGDEEDAPPAQVKVPVVVGQTVAAATQVIEDAGLTVGTVTEQASAADQEGLVTASTPAAGALADPVAAAVFCAPQPARHVVVQGRPVVRDGALLTIDLPAVVREHNRHAALMRG